MTNGDSEADVEECAEFAVSVAGPIPSNADSIAVRCKKVVTSAGNVTIDRQVALWTDECLVIELQLGMPEATAGACL